MGNNTVIKESQLDDLISSNIDKFFPNCFLVDRYYKLIEGSSVVGEIDILAADPLTGSLVVIEDKMGKESYSVIGQVMFYMGFVKGRIPKIIQEQPQLQKGVPYTNVRGIIVCNEPDIKLLYGVNAHPDIALYGYRYDALSNTLWLGRIVKMRGDTIMQSEDLNLDRLMGEVSSILESK
jgi:hypothetical protein